MLLAPLLGATLVVAVATEPMDNHASAVSSGRNLSTTQKAEATEPLIRSATDCIARAVVADPRYGSENSSQLGDLIVDSMPSCITRVRAMIDAYDRYYGEGTGEAFFMGPYLDVLPRAVGERAKKNP